MHNQLVTVFYMECLNLIPIDTVYVNSSGFGPYRGYLPAWGHLQTCSRDYVIPLQIHSHFLEKVIGQTRNPGVH